VTNFSYFDLTTFSPTVENARTSSFCVKNRRRKNRDGPDRASRQVLARKIEFDSFVKEHQQVVVGGFRSVVNAREEQETASRISGIMLAHSHHEFRHGWLQPRVHGLSCHDLHRQSLTPPKAAKREFVCRTSICANPVRRITANWNVNGRSSRCRHVTSGVRQQLQGEISGFAPDIECVLMALR
jgi:hypothetical protein